MSRTNFQLISLMSITYSEYQTSTRCEFPTYSEYRQPPHGRRPRSRRRPHAHRPHPWRTSPQGGKLHHHHGAHLAMVYLVLAVGQAKCNRMHI